MIDLRQKSIVVTGGASGIGAAICAAAYKEGASVGVIDIDDDAAINLCKKLGRRAYCALESPFLLLMIIAVILIITGMFLESIAQIILLTPLLLPILMALGIDPIVFGIVMVISCEVGFLTPPVGANLFVAARITNLGIDKISVAVLPFLLAYIGVLVLVALFPGVITWLPDLVYGKFG
ncbi:MAG: SDR family NAD(P)-dependent oxidoreductase [Alphaproteobacteria bacterium]|jgi:TRAP-type C4-dicarboxylate transport system permease large subunit|nr:SDR family NAD(P)-dependent oxidoreductase [Alphaproteobacteria bacterium]